MNEEGPWLMWVDGSVSTGLRLVPKVSRARRLLAVICKVSDHRWGFVQPGNWYQCRRCSVPLNQPSWVGMLEPLKAGERSDG